MNREVNLCLSGGGFRAAIYHLGVLRWLNEQGVLPRLKTVSCVSGGSIVGAHLLATFGTDWPRAPLSNEEWFTRIVEPFWGVVNRNLRTRPLLKKIFWPPNWLRSWASADGLRKEYIRHLFAGEDPALAELPGRPEFIFCATDMVFGVNWESCHEKVGSYEAGYMKPPPSEWTLARAVATSSCFPPVFPPARALADPDRMKGGQYKRKDRKKKVSGIRLTDGGVYDNLGLQPVEREKVVFSSDGGGILKFERVTLPWSLLVRYASLLQSGIGKLRKRRLMQDFMETPPRKRGSYLDIGQGSRYESPPYPSQDTADLIAAIRTDLNRFTRAEFEILQNHGYLRAAEKTLRYCKDLLDGPPEPEAVQAPYPDWVDPARIRKALRYSKSRFRPHAWR